jgi:predicted aldo/keto reductase-like oxidoreductase
MEPIRGGVLSRKPPEAVAKVWDTAPVQKSYAEWALQWVWNQPEVSLVLSGMSTMEQVKENIASAERSGVGALSTEEVALLDRVRKAYHGLFPVPCTACRYCMPCPSGVNIPMIFECYNDAVAYGAMNTSKGRYNGIRMKGHQADACTECGNCVKACPQKIQVPDQLKKAHAMLANK